MKDLNLNVAGIQSILEPLRKRQYMWQMVFMCSLLIAIAISYVTDLLTRGRNGIHFNATTSGIGWFVFILLIGLSIFAFYQYRIAYKQYVKNYKKLIAEKVLKACFENASYNPEQGFSREEFAIAGVFSMKGRNFGYHSEDLITGTHSGVEFKQSDVSVTHRVPGKNRRTVIDVDGRLVRFYYKKEIQGRILITSKEFLPVATNYSSELYMPIGGQDVAGELRKGFGTAFQTVAMEDVDFNNRFTVYATDPHSVYYLLTPPVMEYLKRLCSMNQKLSIGFDGVFLYILRTGKGGIFAPPNQKGVDVYAEAEKSYRELQEIVQCIEALGLADRQEREAVRHGEGKNVQRKEQLKNNREEQLYKELKESDTGYETEASQVLSDDDFEGIGWSKL